MQEHGARFRNADLYSLQFYFVDLLMLVSANLH
jgi:hypothetical protein